MRTDRLHTVENPITRIGIFDSGVGGLTVLDDCLDHAPLKAAGRKSHYIYLADTAQMPYGEKTFSAILARSLQCISWLITVQQVDCILVACNTAAAALIKGHRLNIKTQRLMAIAETADLPALPLIDPITTVCQHINAGSAYQKMGLLGTQATILSNQHRELLSKDIILNTVPCVGLAKLIESGQHQSQVCQNLLQSFLLPLKQASVEAIILGCTHYPFVAHSIRAALPEAVIINPGTLMAQQLLAIHAEASVIAVSDQFKPGRQENGYAGHAVGQADQTVDFYTTSAPDAPDNRFQAVCSQLPFRQVKVSELGHADIPV
ncbi:MAG: aspartate/glutamate racemase family protein [Cyanobacteria bacterium P01_H01_bin.74]